MKLNEIYNGDCLELMTKVPDKSVDMILCDLPYGTTACKWDVIIPFEPLWKQYERVIKDNGAIVLTASQPFTSALVMSNPKWFRYEWIWEKDQGTGFLNANKMPLRIHENILVYYKTLPTYNPQKTAGHNPYNKMIKNKVGLLSVYGKTGTRDGYVPPVNNGERFPSTLVRFVKDSERYNSQVSNKNLHPTQKPVALFEYLIKTYTNEGETVMDNCSGSGTTAISCIRTNRKYICMEKELKYYELSKERVRKELEQTKLALTA